MSLADIVEKGGSDDVGFGDTCRYHRERGVITVSLVCGMLREEYRGRFIVEPVGRRSLLEGCQWPGCGNIEEAPE